ncbi:hypothetical protein [Methylorubrum extorquens]|uniref:Uncharacterized protein n=1 Tax=Methylorubrum extorquens TaxID=408 RepID=A0AAX3WB18_METEX|nr:hypothetical protein [Methylorubrum extorquens]WHQ68566.1 hypothetical protein KEC54_19600 [Methylorubrum extorquens]
MPVPARCAKRWCDLIRRRPKHVHAAFLGLYHDKQFSHVGRIVTAVGAMQVETGVMVFDKPETGTLDDMG